MPSIPPRSSAEYGDEWHPRNKAVKALKEDKRAEYKNDMGYHKRSLAETTMCYYKQLLRPKLTLRNYNMQVNEALANVKARKKVLRLGIPVSQ